MLCGPQSLDVTVSKPLGDEGEEPEHSGCTGELKYSTSVHTFFPSLLMVMDSQCTDEHWAVILS